MYKSKSWLGDRFGIISIKIVVLRVGRTQGVRRAEKVCTTLRRTVGKTTENAGVWEDLNVHSKDSSCVQL